MILNTINKKMVSNSEGEVTKESERGGGEGEREGKGEKESWGGGVDKRK